MLPESAEKNLSLVLFVSPGPSATGILLKEMEKETKREKEK